MAKEIIIAKETSSTLWWLTAEMHQSAGIFSFWKLEKAFCGWRNKKDSTALDLTPALWRMGKACCWQHPTREYRKPFLHSSSGLNLFKNSKMCFSSLIEWKNKAYTTPGSSCSWWGGIHPFKIQECCCPVPKSAPRCLWTSSNLGAPREGCTCTPWWQLPHPKDKTWWPRKENLELVYLFL